MRRARRRCRTDAVKLMPTRELYRLWLADALVREQQARDARKLLGPLMARGSSAELRQAARQMLGVVAVARTAREWRRRRREANLAGAGCGHAARSPVRSVVSRIRTRRGLRRESHRAG